MLSKMEVQRPDFISPVSCCINVQHLKGTTSASAPHIPVTKSVLALINYTAMLYSRIWRKTNYQKHVNCKKRLSVSF